MLHVQYHNELEMQSGKTELEDVPTGPRPFLGQSRPPGAFLVIEAASSVGVFVTVNSLQCRVLLYES